ncbi:porphobilinogen deaminase [Litorimonas cladophorae]|uniref:Porphobilinogen deaminase n=1 Tax=Litorimonas cladophorae TaxID=1220491 RepID=A0A918KR06_9PROT|nr:hydroxymethylbilane synthase [Litorimonas cladophorae]GGX72388.1 porphobilinogen deaminase [Litorimonas cladophorae]
MQSPALTIGTRGSPLALYQANLVQRLICEASGRCAEQVVIKVLKTTGDTIKGELKDFGGKGLFTRELEMALLDGTIDLAVHSMKDVPTVGHEDLVVSAILPRADVRDAFISVKHGSIDDLPQGALIGSASLRRRAQLSAMRPDLQFCLLRGNVGTRLKKLEAGVCDATMLACAGLRRLEQDDRITQAVETDMMLPAPAQGAIGIEVMRNRADLTDVLAPLNDRSTELEITAERAFLRALDGNCRTPIAALAKLDGEHLTLRGEILAKDGSLRIADECVGPVATAFDAYDLGFKMGASVRKQVGGRITFDD